MEALSLKTLNAGPILTDLLVQIPAINVTGNVYVSPLREDNQLSSPAMEQNIDALGISGAVLPTILGLLGIRSLTMHAKDDLTQLASLDINIPNPASDPYQWHYLKNDAVIGGLRS